MIKWEEEVNKAYDQRQNGEVMGVKFDEMESPFEKYPFAGMTKWQRLKLWVRADVPYFFDRVWYRLTGKWLLK